MRQCPAQEIAAQVSVVLNRVLTVVRIEVLTYTGHVSVQGYGHVWTHRSGCIVTVRLEDLTDLGNAAGPQLRCGGKLS